ncbi:hypothetical protein NC652_031023 [Populus alba x Populus x berolinensis]|nr:hypothetical protein NC652_031023 [Populus alba x Populus x berolinensis]
MVKTMTVGFPADLLVCEGEILVWKLRFERGRWYGGRKEMICPGEETLPRSQGTSQIFCLTF